MPQTFLARRRARARDASTMSTGARIAAGAANLAAGVGAGAALGAAAAPKCNQGDLQCAGNAVLSTVGGGIVGGAAVGLGSLFVAAGRSRWKKLGATTAKTTAVAFGVAFLVSAVGAAGR